MGKGRIREIKAKGNNGDLLKLKTFCTANNKQNNYNPHIGRKYLQMM